ncbi:ABC transporter permease [Sagittula sp. M10.9X]|uniref:Transport permease protein n=1 Tax=Sagittula salina TaxID=2820268 RepID=A0A940MMB3_9RHOB|nr:ABC transporter permease [Sagittula salina]
MPAPLAPKGPPLRRRRPLPRLVTLRAVAALMLREMSTTYGRSPGGYLWAVLEPVAGIALLTAVFSISFHAPSLGKNFAMFYATGMLPFILFTDITGKLSQALNYSRPLLVYPRVTFVDAIAARFALNLMVQVLVGYIVLGGIMAVFETRVRPDGGTIVTAYALVGLLTLGVGTLNSYLTVRFPIYQRIWSIAMRPLFLVSCIFFLFDSIPEPYRDWLWFNPLVHVIGLVRRGFYPTYSAPYVSEIYVLALGLGTLVAGLMLLRRDHKMLLEL